MIENKDEIIKELREILNKNRINTEEERELYFFKLRDLENKAIYYKDDKTRKLLCMYEKSMLDKTNSFLSAYEKGVKKGIEEGRKIGKRKVAVEASKVLLSEDFDINEISKITGLSISEIEELK